MNQFLPEVPFFCIHLDRAVEREPFMTVFQTKLGRPIQRWSASEGTEIAKLGWPRKHPHEPRTSDGALGCLDSHLRLLRHMLEKGYPMIGIFEDDAEFTGTLEELVAFYEEASSLEPAWDILVLGANEWVDVRAINPRITRPSRYWGTHAFLIRREAAEKVLALHTKFQQMGYAYPADWLYSAAVTQSGLVAYGSRNPKLIRQKPGLVSAINGNVRN